MTKLSVAMMAMAGVLVSASVARADDTVKAKIPFAFVVNGTELPAGHYVFRRDASQPELIDISTAAGTHVVLVLTRAGDRENGAAEQPALEFERVGKQVFLTEVTMGPWTSREFAAPPANEDETPKR